MAELQPHPWGWIYSPGSRIVAVSESRRDQEQGGELDSHEEVRLSYAGPGEIKRREVVLDPPESPGEINSREVELG